MLDHKSSFCFWLKCGTSSHVAIPTNFVPSALSHTSPSLKNAITVSLMPSSGVNVSITIPSFVIVRSSDSV